MAVLARWKAMRGKGVISLLHFEIVGNGNFGVPLKQMFSVWLFTLIFAVQIRFFVDCQIIKINRFKHVVKFFFQAISAVIQSAFFVALVTVVTPVIFLLLS